MNCNFSIDLNADNIERLKALLGSQNEEELSTALSSVAKAVFSEHLDHLCRSRPIGTATEMRDSKVYFVIRDHFGRIPSDLELSKVTGLSLAYSGSSIKNVLQRYKFEMSEIINKSVTEILPEVKDNHPDYYTFKCRSSAVIELMNQDLSDSDNNLEMIYQKPKIKGTYIIKPTSLLLLKDKYGNG